MRKGRAGNDQPRPGPGRVRVESVCVRECEGERRKKPTFVTAAQADAGCRANPHPLIRRPRTADPSLRFALARPAWEQDCVHFSCTHLLTTLLPGLVDSSVSMAGPLPQERERELGPFFFCLSLSVLNKGSLNSCCCCGVGFVREYVYSPCRRGLNLVKQDEVPDCVQPTWGSCLAQFSHCCVRVQNPSAFTPRRPSPCWFKHWEGVRWRRRK